MTDNEKTIADDQWAHVEGAPVGWQMRRIGRVIELRNIDATDWLGRRVFEVPEPSTPARITIGHEGGNTVSGTPEDVLNHGHLKPGWRYVGSEPQGEPSDAPKVVTLDDVYEVTGLDALVTEARSRGEWCCENGCGSGACETCPCCTAGWCVSGVDGLPEDAEAREFWLEVAAEFNPVAAALRAASAVTEQGENR
jgi:hypothetical protein